APTQSKILLEETRETVRHDGTIEVLYRHARQVLTSRSPEVGMGSFFFDETYRIQRTKAWHIPPGKGAKKSRQPPIDVTVGDAFLTDNKVRAVPVEDVKKGSIVLFEFSAIETPYALSRIHTFGNDAPAVLQRYVVEVPEGWTVQWDWIRGGGQAPVVQGSTYTWEVRDAPEPKDEPLGPSLLEQLPALAINVLPPPDTKAGDVKPEVFHDWGEFSAWYENLLSGRQEATTAIQQVASKLESDGDGVYGTIGDTGRYVRDKVRYVAVELGIGGKQPHPAAETLANLYGDCKDKGTLFRSLLSVDGLKSYPVLVNSSYDRTLSEKIPAWGFDHYVVAVPLPAGKAVPDSLSHAILKTDDLGPLLIVDTTDEKTSVGSMSAALSGKRALLVDGAEGRLVTLPGKTPDAHGIERRITGRMSASGTLEIERRSSYHGYDAAATRASYSASSEDRRRGIERRVLDIWPQAKLGDYSVDYETADGAYVETIDCTLPGKSGNGAGRRLEIFPGARAEVPRVSLSRREVPVVYLIPWTTRYDVEFSGLPEGAALPDPVEASGEGWSVRTSATLEGGVVRGSLVIVVEKSRYEPSEFGSLREFWTAVTRAAGSAVKIPG
ncbi:MAG TPA: DUF3857 domain-containing protein, partial [Candidatus Saccharimonadales bacterium]|nr:DUF3857 domain-containing protein [Candidatus Saccharimonadales bacterium]